MADRVHPGSHATAFGSPLIREAKAHDPEPNTNSDQHPWFQGTETYIVQVAKDQIYRVPPPENAALVEHYRNLVAKRTKRNPVLTCLGWSCASLITLVFLCLIVIIIFIIAVRPGKPQFTVDQLHVKTSTAMSPEYDFTLSLRNPSGSMSYSYDHDGAAFLSYHGVNIAIGKTPALNQDSKSTSKIKIVTNGMKMVEPKHIAKALKGSKDDVELNLELDIDVSAKAWGLEINGMHIHVSCDVTSEGLLEEPSIKMQSCQTELRT